MNLILIDYYSDDYTREEIRDFWDQGVDMDDWDYMILAPVDILEEVDATDWDGKPIKRLVPKGYTFERLLTGCCHNKWYKATFRGIEYAVGVAYHA